MLRVTEIFHSIQGESSFAGRPCVFVRLTGCDLRCVWCDSTYAFGIGELKAVDEVVGEVLALGCELVEITGGEPLVQDDAYLLMERLVGAGRTVLLETGGHRPLDRVPAAVIKIVDVKCPGSGEAHRTHWENLERLSPRDEVKFVIADRADYDYARSVVDRYHLAARCHAVLFAPAFDLLLSADLAAWILHDRLPVRLQLQLHKYIWGAAARGV